MLLLVNFNLAAQKNYFLYVQTENKQPFSLRMEGKIYSSDELGYLIVPRILAGDYTLIVDFPKKKTSSLYYDMTLNHQDMGFILMNDADKGWVLQNLLSPDRIVSRDKDDEKKQDADQGKDEFTEMLSQITGASQQDKVDKDILKNQNQAGVEIIDTLKTTEGLNDAPKDFLVQRFTTFLDDNGRSASYLVKESGGVDTVHLLFPGEFPDTTLSSGGNISANDTLSKKQTVTPEASENKYVTNSKTLACKEFAEERDFLHLRKKMVTQDNEGKMIDVAARAFRSKCYSTDYIMRLAVIFLKDDNRLQFLLNSRNAVSDAENFINLQTLLSEEKNILFFKEAFLQ
ncbi:MAG: hypothetical protein FGM46_03900 [Ferruginibacter sp.]|nr:hypothetical protein [Ferruginibacter sp.]